MANFLWFLFCLINIMPSSCFQKMDHDTGSDQLYAQQKGGLLSVALGERCVGSWKIYGRKQGIPWQLF